MALHGFAYSKAALNALEGLQKKHRRQVRKKIEKLADDPRPKGSKVVHGVLDGDREIYRIRSGKYRILYSVRESPATVVVLDIGHRKDIYRRLT